MTLRQMALVAGLLPLVACTSPEDAFIDGRTVVQCNSDVPVCTTVADCVLDQTNYSEGSFNQGANVSFVVHTDNVATVTVSLFFVTETSPGIDTEITFYESECETSDDETSGGADIFQQAGPGRIWSKSYQFLTLGDHLIDVFSDSQASYLLEVSIQ